MSMQGTRKRQQKRARKKAAGAAKSGSAGKAAQDSTPTASKRHASQPLTEVAPAVWWSTMVLVATLFVWSYWPVLLGLFDQWNRVPDYSHGILVAPLAIWFLWITRDSLAGLSKTISWAGAVLLLFAAGLRMVGALYYLEALHGWSIPIWLTGFVWMFFGWHAFKWSLPAIAFLVFMVPLPYSVEHMLSRPLQQLSANISLFILQCLQQPAISEGTTIILDSNNLEIERACSGLRIFFGIAALACAFMILFKRPMWTKLALVLAILPITLLANSIRIVSTGLLFQLGMGETAKHLSHDLAGWFMIVLAGAFFAVTLKYIDKLFPEINTIDVGAMVREQVGRQTSPL